MIENTSTAPQVAGDVSSAPPFLATHRAVSVCGRELTRLTTEVVQGITTLHNTGIVEKPLVRQAPARCIVQLGPVALSIAWLRSTHDVVAEGELLVTLWHGAVGSPGRHRPERTSDQPTSASATALWDEVFVVHAANEATWSWQSRRVDAPALTSSELAAEIVARLQENYVTLQR